jgi:anti-sigma regulatory factor (Ser/Thr protein kinase)
VAYEIAPCDVEIVVTSARDLKAVRESLSWLSLPDPLGADVVLAASEVVTNALQYAGAPCELRAWFPIVGGAVRVEVSDRDAGAIDVRRGPVRPDAPRGRGFNIIEQLVSRWGIELSPPAGKVIWFEVDPGG